MIELPRLDIKITEFQGEFRFLSNFWSAPVTMDGMTFGSTETAYQAAKTLDMQQRQQFASMNPGQAKRAGRNVTLRKDWDQVKLKVMEDLVRQKFTNHPDLRQKLLDTGDAELIEGNTWNDTFWGVCRDRGQNHLGKILMKVRKELGGK